MGFATIGSLFGLGGGAGSAANLAARQNAYQNYLINSGTQDINAIFGGGTSAPQYAAAGGAPTSGTQYYKAAFGKSPTGKTFGYVPVTLKPGRKNTKGLYTSVPGQAYTGFQPNFYNNAANAYTQYATPQLGQQYFQAQQALGAGMANQGLLRSSANQSGQSLLNTTYGQQQQQIVDTGQQQAQALQGDVESARENALSQLYATANPGQANATALQTAAGIQVPSAFAPLGNAFSNILSNYALQQAYNNNPQLGYYAPANTNYGANAGALPSNTY